MKLSKENLEHSLLLKIWIDYDNDKKMYFPLLLFLNTSENKSLSLVHTRTFIITQNHMDFFDDSYTQFFLNPLGNLSLSAVGSFLILFGWEFYESTGTVVGRFRFEFFLT